MDVMQIQLVRKLADHLDGVDVSMYNEGDVIELARRQAELLIAEQWAVPCQAAAPREVRGVSTAPALATAADRLQLRTLEQMRRLREEMDNRRFEEQERRRAEDRIREELHDAQAKTIGGDASS